MPRKKRSVYDIIEDVFMEADAETFANLEERIATIKRLRKLDRKPTRFQTVKPAFSNPPEYQPLPLLEAKK